MTHHASYAQLLKNTSSAWTSCLEHSLSSVLDLVQDRMVLIIGSGCSFPLACLLATVLQHTAKKGVSPSTPFAFLNSSLQPEVGIVISVKGTNLHALKAYDEILSRNALGIVITCDSQSPLAIKSASTNGLVLAPPSTCTEDSFISVVTSAAISALIANACRITFQRNPFAYELKNQFLDLPRSKAYHIVMGTSWAFPAAQELETRIVECGFATSAVSDIWNLAHGRYMTTVNSKTPLILLSGHDTPQSSIIRAQEDTGNIIRLVTELDGPASAFDISAKAIALAGALAIANNSDPVRPTIPDWAVQLDKSER